MENIMQNITNPSESIRRRLDSMSTEYLRKLVAHYRWSTLDRARLVAIYLLLLEKQP